MLIFKNKFLSTLNDAIHGVLTEPIATESSGLPIGNLTEADLLFKLQMEEIKEERSQSKEEKTKK